MNEIWKDIPGYEGRYQASNQGRIRSLDRFEYFEGGTRKNGKTFKPSRRKMSGRILRPAPHKSGHIAVVLGRKGGTKDVHVLVVRTFIGEPAICQEVMHLDHNPANNRLENLKYGTRAENIKMSRDIGKYKTSKNFNRWGYRYD